jgi:hypothetical protein
VVFVRQYTIECDNVRVFGTGRRPALVVAAAVGALCCGTVAAACSDEKSTTKPTSVPRTTSIPTTSVPPTTAVAPGNATPTTIIQSTNKWQPLTPGLQLVSQGFVNRGHRRLPHRRVYTITDVTKEIDGTRTVLVLDQDFDGGEIAEQALDYLAEDQQGNVLYLGSYTETYEGGQFVNATDAWLSGVNGGQKGILMTADPKPGASFTEAKVPGEGTATAQVVKNGQQTCVPFKCYADVLVIQEGSENKYFAPGVGGIKTEPRSGGEQETEELINLTQLSPQGLAEISAEALRLDQHAATEARDVFRGSAAAARPS